MTKPQQGTIAIGATVVLEAAREISDTLLKAACDCEDAPPPIAAAVILFVATALIMVDLQKASLDMRRAFDGMRNQIDDTDPHLLGPAKSLPWDLPALIARVREMERELGVVA